MGTSKILIDGVGIDLTADTVAADKMLNGTKAHDSNGDSITGNITSKSAATYTPGTSSQTIAAGQYLSGAQTILGDTNLVATNIKDGVSIFGTTGSLKFEDLKVWEATVSSDKTASFNMITDSWLTAHYADANLIVAVFPEFALPASACWAYSIAANFQLTQVTGQSSMHSIRGYHTNNSSTISSVFAARKVSENHSQPGEFMISNGSLRMFGQSTYKVVAGKYLAIAALAKKN